MIDRSSAGRVVRDDLVYERWKKFQRTAIAFTVVEYGDKYILTSGQLTADILRRNDEFMDKIAWENDMDPYLDCTCQKYVIGNGPVREAATIDLMILRRLEDFVMEDAQALESYEITVENPFFKEEELVPETDDEEENDEWVN